MPSCRTAETPASLARLRYLTLLIAAACWSQILMSGGAVAEQQSSTTSAVKELTADNFNATTGAADYSLVMFYAPWCPHCQEAKPKFAEAALKLAAAAEPTTGGEAPAAAASKQLAMMNCDEKENTAFCSTMKIEGYPTAKIFKKSQFFRDFEEDLSVASIMSQMADPEKAITEVPQKEGDEEEKPEPDIPMLGVPLLDASNITDFLKSRPHVMVFFYAPWCGHCQEAKPKYEKAAGLVAKDPQMQDKLLVAVNCDAATSRDYCNEIKVEGFPTLRYFHFGEMFQEFEEEPETDAFMRFMKNPPKTKVAPTPIEEEKGKEDEKMTDVDYLTGKEHFKQFISKEGRHSLVMFFSPWCSHCQAAKPKFSAAAGQVKAAPPADASQELKMAALSCEDKQNEEICASERIEGLPTLRHYYAGKTMSDYTEAPITESGLVKFMLSLLTTKSASKEEL